MNHKIFIRIDKECNKKFKNIRKFINISSYKILEYVQLTEIKDFFEISITLINDKKMQKINKQYRNKDKTTDVLSFSQLEGEHIPHIEDRLTLLGDVIISYETCYKQAKEKNKSFYEELLILLIHGIYHLLGYDHERSKEEEKIMKDKERKLYKYIVKEEAIKRFLVLNTQ